MHLCVAQIFNVARSRTRARPLRSSAEITLKDLQAVYHYPQKKVNYDNLL
jgi:hypothetical protein